MPHLWFQTDRAWNVFPLEESPVALLPDSPVAISDVDTSDRVEAALHKRANGAWLLFAPAHSETRVNGLRFPGIRLLQDRDEIRVSGKTLFFSTERLASVEAYAGASKAFCPRCRQEIANGTPAVQCPGCGVWHHENGDLNCWTYADHCALCPQKTPLNDAYDACRSYQWTPEVM